jgi:hypothetical protein
VQKLLGFYMVPSLDASLLYQGHHRATATKANFRIIGGSSPSDPSLAQVTEGMVTGDRLSSFISEGAQIVSKTYMTQAERFTTSIQQRPKLQ